MNPGILDKMCQNLGRQTKPFQAEYHRLKAYPSFFWLGNSQRHRRHAWETRDTFFILIYIPLYGSGYSKRLAWAHGFNAKICIKKYATGPEILAKMSKNIQVWFGNLIFGIFCLISWDPGHIFKTDFCIKTVSSSRLFWVAWSLYSEDFFFDLLRGPEIFYVLWAL